MKHSRSDTKMYSERIQRPHITEATVTTNDSTKVVWEWCGDFSQSITKEEINKLTPEIIEQESVIVQDDVLDISQLEMNNSNNIGAGGFGTVYSGFYLKTPVAIKVLNVGNTDQSRRQFQREISILR